MRNLLGLPYPERKKLINDLQTNGECAYEYPLKFQGKISNYKVYIVGIDMPKYRLNNGRTQAAQLTYVATRENVAKDFFTADYESIEAHEVQHEILNKMVDKDLKKFFTKESQDRPLIIDQDGFVINGNRRLCTFRELYHSDPQNFEHLGHIQVLILPPCSEKDKDELEANLQIKKDIKADYDWVSEALMLKKRQVDHNYSLKDLSSMYDMKEKDIKEKIDMLSYGDEYLHKIGKPNKYELIFDSEYAFQAIASSRKKHSNMGESYKSILKDINYLILKDSQEENLIDSGRIYNVINQVSKHFKRLTEKLADEFESEINDQLQTDNNEAISLFGGATGSSDDHITSLSKNIANVENEEDILTVVKDTIEEEKALEKEKANKRACFNHIKKAHTELSNAYTILNEESDLKGVLEQLEAMEKLVDKIKEKLKDEVIH